MPQGRESLSEGEGAEEVLPEDGEKEHEKKSFECVKKAMPDFNYLNW